MANRSRGQDRPDRGTPAVPVPLPSPQQSPAGEGGPRQAEPAFPRSRNWKSAAGPTRSAGSPPSGRACPTSRRTPCSTASAAPLSYQNQLLADIKALLEPARAGGRCGRRGKIAAKPLFFLLCFPGTGYIMGAVLCKSTETISKERCFPCPEPITAAGPAAGAGSACC